MLTLDTLGMFQATTDTANQLLKGASNVGDLKSFSDIQNIVVVGMGGSAMAGEMAAAIVQPEIDIPIKVVRSHELPAFVNQKTLLLAVSFSGDTQETLQAVESAVKKSTQILAITTGGKLQKLSAKHGFESIAIDKSIPMPRAGLAEMAGTILALLGKLGIFASAQEELTKAHIHIEKRIPELSGKDSPAYKLAQDIGRTIPLLMGASDIGAVAAKRWKTQINENAKMPSFFSEAPEAFHNEIAGWGLHGDVTRQVFSSVQLRSDFEVEALDKAFSVALEMQREVVSKCYEVRAKGDGMLSQLMDLVLFGDFCSIYLADLAGVDPGSIPAISEFKKMV